MRERERSHVISNGRYISLKHGSTRGSVSMVFSGLPSWNRGGSQQRRDNSSESELSFTRPGSRTPELLISFEEPPR